MSIILDQELIHLNQRYPGDESRKLTNLCRVASVMAIPNGRGNLTTVSLYSSIHCPDAVLMYVGRDAFLAAAGCR